MKMALKIKLVSLAATKSRAIIQGISEEYGFNEE